MLTDDINAVTMRAYRRLIDRDDQTINPTLRALLANSDPRVYAPEPVKTLLRGRPWMDVQ